MTVLLVDDQIRILSGLISGLDWDALEVSSIRTATNAAQAKIILQEEHVDILLCDIEMPGENGLSLLRWARNRNMDFVCVFLTSHADFLYAKEAIQLNCFDYILQPARYDEIQATVARAIARVKDTSAVKELLHYGAIAKSQEAALFQNLFSDWSAGKELSISALQSVLQKLGRDLRPESQCFVIWGPPAALARRALAHPGLGLRPEQHGQRGVRGRPVRHFALLHRPHLPGLVIYAPQGDFPDTNTLLAPLNKAYLAISQHMPCDLAFYVSPVIPLKEINSQAALLLDAKQNNVLRESGIFCPTQHRDKLHMEKFLDTTQLRRWGLLLSQGLGPTVLEEALAYLDTLVETGEIDQRALRNFWIQFQQAALNAALAKEMDSHDLLQAIEQGDKAGSPPGNPGGFAHLGGVLPPGGAALGQREKAGGADTRLRGGQPGPVPHRQRRGHRLVHERGLPLPAV